MSLSASVKCRVHITTPAVFPGDAVEGHVTVEVLKAFPVRNIHIKIVGRERVNAMVDHVSQSKTKSMQFGITTQDFVYYREITTLVGDLLSVKRSHDGGSRSPSRQPSPGAGTNDDAPLLATANNSFVLESPTEGSATPVGRADPDGTNTQLNRSFAITGASMLAAIEGGYVTLPEGTFTFPFRYLLPDEVPPSYNTGVKVRDQQYSNSMAHLAYYVKVYVLSSKKLLASSSEYFTVKPMQPIATNRTFLGCHGRRLKAEAKVVECRFAVSKGTCCFGGGGGSGSGSGGSKLVVKMMLAQESYEIHKDEVKVVCVVLKNTTGKVIQGVRLSLVQNLTFQTVKANVPMSSVVLSQDTTTKIEPNEEKKSIVATLSKIPVQEDIMPTMSTTGLHVDYDLRVEVLCNTQVVADPFYVFEGVVLAAFEDPMSAPPTSEMDFAALPRGRLSRREAYYAVPSNPACEPSLPSVVPASVRPSPAPSRRTSLLAHHE